ncbi:MAG: SAM-dependent methyltransferase [Verrucomicrobia subdivision 3 bacterium]|nr:SAM-dependent methyltransferase [Limisphaerales bacterium]
MEPVEAMLRQEILARGSISFAHFMEIALYCPKIGYYEGDPGVVGRRGDFYTSVSAGPLFGELLARQFSAWVCEMGLDQAQIVEAGAHDGRLAGDILGWLPSSHRRASIKYWIIEESERRREWQRARLEVFAGQVEWFASFDHLPGPVEGVIFCNELLDAFPFCVLQWRGKQWVELKVGFDEGRFVWRPAPAEPALTPKIPREIEAVLPEAFQIEVCPAARMWWRTAARQLARGKLITFDYGFEADEFLSPARADGTARAYFEHRMSNDLLARPGQQDVTAHVNFTEIQIAGESAGLQTERFTSQSKFLTEIAAQIEDWPSDRVRQFQTLTHPEHLGRAFKVLIQSRDAIPTPPGSRTS